MPTVAESGVPGFDYVTWYAVYAPAATPQPVVEQLNKWMNEILATEESRQFIYKFGGDPWIGTPEEGQAQLVKDKADWEGYVKTAKIDPQ